MLESETVQGYTTQVAHLRNEKTSGAAITRESRPQPQVEYIISTLREKGAGEVREDPTTPLFGSPAAMAEVGVDPGVHGASDHTQSSPASRMVPS